MRSFRLLAVAVLAVTLALSSAQNVYAASIGLTPNPVTQGSSFQVTGFGFPINNVGTLSVYADTSGNCTGPTSFQQNVTPDGSGQVGPLTFSSSSLGVGIHCILIDFGAIRDNNELTVTAPASAAPVVIEVPYSVCVVQVGLVQQDGSIEWIGTGVTGAPISECQNTTVYLTDVGGGTVAFHQFILNGTSFKIMPIGVV